MLGKEALVHRNKKITNLSESKSIGILYDASEKESAAVVREFVKKLRDSKRVVKALGYVNSTIPDDSRVAKLEFDYFTKADVNWYFLPNSGVLRNFCNEPYEILIDLTNQQVIPLLYAVAWSKSQCKVGRLSEKYASYYDIMIDCKNEQSITELIQQTMHYLSIINSRKNG